LNDFPKAEGWLEEVIRAWFILLTLALSLFQNIKSSLMPYTADFVFLIHYGFALCNGIA